MKDWLRRNHPAYLIYKFKEFKVMYMSSNAIYLAKPWLTTSYLKPVVTH